MFVFRLNLFLLGVFLLVSVPFMVSASSLEIASTVTLEGNPIVLEGTVVVQNSESEVYAVSDQAHDAQVFGVTAEAPSLVFSTGADEVPVVSEGVAYIQVLNGNGQILRGDLLVTAALTGVAMKAGALDDYVFAIALEDYDEADGDTVGLIQAEIGVEKAQAILSLRRQTEEVTGDGEDKSLTPSIVRAVVAIALVVGALFFILYSFRSTISQGVVSIGRNPRAKRSIMTLAFGNIIFALLLCAVVIFIAIAVLILPL